MLRGRLIEELEVVSTAELMLLDVAIVAYRNLLQVQTWVGNLAALVEHHLFGVDGPTAKLKIRHGPAYGLKAEDDAARVRESLLPAAERAGRHFVSMMRGLRDFKRTSGVSVVVGAAGQVNVADQQVAIGSLSR